MSSSAFFTGVSGLLVHSQRLNVVANNIANVNTTGFRGARVQFQDLLSQTIQGGSPPSGNLGGKNPIQVGLGVQVASIDSNFTQGALLGTGINSDLAIQGSGFFVLSDGQTPFYTRDGSFSLNANGALIDPATGLFVQGYLPDENGVIQVASAPTNLIVPLGGESIVRATSEVSVVGNLNSMSDVGDTVVRRIQFFDSLGTAREITVTFTKRAQLADEGAVLRNAWDWQAEFTNGDTPPVTTAVGAGTLLFDDGGTLVAEGTESGGVFTSRPAGDPEVSISGAALGGAASVPETPIEFDILFDATTELDAPSDFTQFSQNGFPPGTLESFNVGGDGIINGVFTNGLTRVLGQVALANFPNVGGLSREGNNLFRETPASGVALVGAPNTGGRGEVTGGVLEGSNVDLAAEFSNLLITQRGFQANARTITAADTLLNETVNLIR